MDASAEYRERYERDGYLVLPGMKSAAEIAALRARAEEIVAAFDEREPMRIFTTADERAKNDDYFLSSGSTIRCFFEADAFDAAGRLAQPKALSINKIGHAMHDLDPVFAAFSHGPRLAAVAAAVGLERPRLYQSMYIFKQPNIGGEVRWHQDATYFVTDPVSVTTFWFALEAADRSNGCLWVQPGGHRTPLRERFVVADGVAGLERLDPLPWPDGADAVPLEVEPGTLVVFHGLLPHYSAPNRSPRSRHAYTLHAVDAAAAYAAGNWLQRSPAFPAHSFAG
jgi:phytanoyl-CoA hydroxylase